MKKRAVLALLVLLTVGLSGAHARKVDYQFEPPGKPWVKSRAKGADFAYRNPTLNAGIIISRRCEEGIAEPPLKILFRHLFIDFEKQNITKQRQFELDGKQALLTELTAEYGGERFKFISVITKRKTCVYDLLLVAPPDRFDEVRGDFEKLLNSFRFK